MLNTDLHNPQIRVCAVALTVFHVAYALFQKRMTIEDYTRNLKGVNDGGDFSFEFLVGFIIQATVQHFIVSPDEHL